MYLVKCRTDHTYCELYPCSPAHTSLCTISVEADDNLKQCELTSFSALYKPHHMPLQSNYVACVHMHTPQRSAQYVGRNSFQIARECWKPTNMTDEHACAKTARDKTSSQFHTVVVATVCSVHRS